MTAPIAGYKFYLVRHVPQYHTACQIQKKILEALGLEMQQANQTPKPAPNAPKLRPAEICSLAKAWSDIEERKRILRMKGLPKPVEANSGPKKAKPKTFVE